MTSGEILALATAVFSVGLTVGWFAGRVHFAEVIISVRAFTHAGEAYVIKNLSVRHIESVFKAD